MNKNKKRKRRKIIIRKNTGKEIIIHCLKFILILITFFVLISIKSKPKSKFTKEFKPINNTTIIQRKKFIKLSREEAVNNFQKYLEICKNDSLINTKAFVKSKEPIMSAIIPVYNSQDTIKLAIRSIQNQEMENMEIILVNDKADANTTKILEEIKKEDPRISIIYNDKRMSSLYSRCIGVLAAKGKYITFVDHDDMFCDKDVFEVLYDETEEEKYDIVSFLAFENFKNGYKDVRSTVKANKNILTGYQPDIGIYPSKENHPIYYNNALIWGKIIKTEPFKEAVNKFGKERYSTFVTWSEDTTLFFVVCTTAQSYKYIEKYGIFHKVFAKSSTSLSGKKERMFGELFNLETIFDFSKNEYKNFTIDKLLKMKTWAHFTLEDEKIKEYFKSVIKKILNSKYIEEKYKNEIRKAYARYNLTE